MKIVMLPEIQKQPKQNGLKSSSQVLRPRTKTINQQRMQNFNSELQSQFLSAEKRKMLISPSRSIHDDLIQSPSIQNQFDICQHYFGQVQQRKPVKLFHKNKSLPDLVISTSQNSQNDITFAQIKPDPVEQQPKQKQRQYSIQMHLEKLNNLKNTKNLLMCNKKLFQQQQNKEIASLLDCNEQNMYQIKPLQNNQTAYKQRPPPLQNVQEDIFKINMIRESVTEMNRVRDTHLKNSKVFEKILPKKRLNIYFQEQSQLTTNQDLKNLKRLEYFQFQIENFIHFSLYVSDKIRSGFKQVIKKMDFPTQLRPLLFEPNGKEIDYKKLKISLTQERVQNLILSEEIIIKKEQQKDINKLTFDQKLQILSNSNLMKSIESFNGIVKQVIEDTLSDQQQMRAEQKQQLEQIIQNQLKRLDEKKFHLKEIQSCLNRDHIYKPNLNLDKVISMSRDESGGIKLKQIDLILKNILDNCN